MKTPQDKLDATCRMTDAESRRLLATLNSTARESSKIDTNRGYPVERWGDTLVDAATHESWSLAVAPAPRKWTRSYVCRLRERDFAAQATLRPPLIGWIAFIFGFVARFVSGRRRLGGNAFGIIVDEKILDLLGITPEAELEVSAEGNSLVITPRVLPQAGGRRTAQAGSQTVKTHAGTFRKLAW